MQRVKPRRPNWLSLRMTWPSYKVIGGCKFKLTAYYVGLRLEFALTSTSTFGANAAPKFRQARVVGKL